MDKRIIIVILLLIIAILSALVYNKFKEEQDIIDIPTPAYVQPTENNNEEAPYIESPEKEQPTTKPAEEKSVEVTEEMVNNIKDNSYLNILVQIKSFNSFNVNYEPLLEAAMRIATEQGLLQTSMDEFYIEYISRSTINDIIFELSGVRVTDPIIIDDFYYSYDEVGDYYYVVPIGANWLQLKEVKSIAYTKDDVYLVKCSASGGDENLGDLVSYSNMELKLKYKPSNKYVNYQLVSINPGKED